MNGRFTRLYFTTILLFLLTAWNGYLYAQDEKKFHLYTANDGLSDNNITGLAQDNYGFIWISSLRGLNRYDGRHFKQIHAGKNLNSLPDESVTRLVWLDKNHLAGTTGMGVYVLNTLTGKANNIIIPAYDQKYQYKYNVIMALLGDNEGNTYVMSRSGFYQYDSSYRLVFRFDYYKKNQVDTAEFEFGSEMAWLSDNEILLYTIEGGYIFNKKLKQLTRIRKNDQLFPELDSTLFSNNIIRQLDPGKILLFDRNADSLVYVNGNQKKKIVTPSHGRVLVDEFDWRTRLFKLNDSTYFITSRQNGFFKLNFSPSTGRLVMDTERRLPQYFCSDFIIDRENRLWVSTSAGLLKESDNVTSVSQISIPQEILNQSPGINIRQVLCYKDKIYAACASSGGLLVFDKKNQSFIKRISFRKFGLIPENFFSLLQARGDTIYIGADGDLLWLKASTEETGEVKLEDWDKLHNWVSGQFKDSKGNIWITSNNNAKIYVLYAGASAFKRLNYAQGEFQKLLASHRIIEDASGNIWMSGHGVARLNAAGKVDLFIDSFPHIILPRKEVSSFAFDKNNVLWTGIANNGLTAYDLNKKTFQHFTANEGLPDNFIKAIQPINNKLWIATATGIASLDLRTNNVSKFSPDDGFSLMPVTSTNLFLDSASHYLYAGFTNRIVRFNPDSLLHSESPPSLFVENVRFSNDSSYAYPGETIKLPYYKNDIAVTVGSINFNDVNNQRIAYRIVNSDDVSWQPLTGDLINFNNLSPGTYHLQIRLSAANNRWHAQVKELNIVIIPPFWKTSWFTAVLSLALFFLLYTIYISKVNSVKRTERTKAQVQELKAEEYKNRLELEKISHYFSSSLSDKKNINEILWDVAGNLISRMGFVDCIIYMWNEDKTKMVQKAAYGPKGTPEAIAWRVFDVVAGQGVVGHVMQTKKAIIVGDTRKDKRYRMDDMFRLSEISVPIIHNDELLGVIDSEHHIANYFNEWDLKILTTIATLVGNKIKQLESEQTLAVQRYEIATINEQLAEAQLIALQAQMNPHFIFNALNSIKRMILDNETANASRYLSTFAQMIRLTLSHSKTTFVTLRETIEYLHAYLDMEQLRFGSSFSYKIEISGKPDEEEVNVPTLMIQPLAENAIWHGLMHKAGDKKIVIRFAQLGDMVTCSIRDNGIGIRQSEKMKQTTKRPHVGLENLRNRIKIMNEKYDLNCTLDISDIGESDVHQTGTMVVLRFKIIPQKVSI